jgi:hypothetical protein
MLLLKLKFFPLLSLAFIISCSPTNNTANNNASFNNLNNMQSENQKKLNEKKITNTDLSKCDTDFNCNNQYTTNYKIPENIPFFIKDFIKNNPEINNPEQAVNLLIRQSPNEEAIKLVSPALQPLRKNWLVYRSKFIEPVRIKAGIDFWHDNKELLKKVEEEFKVEAHIIIGIIGVESVFGRHMGNFNVLNTLYTLSFYYPETPNKKDREKMFQK